MTAAAPPLPEMVIRARRGWAGLDFAALWSYRELLMFLVWRDLKVRYKQTALGAAWALLQPLFSIVLFSVIFGTFARLPSDGVPYPILTCAALLPWTLFQGVVGRSGSSLVSSTQLVSKVYFPRVIVPLAAGLASVVDFLLSFLVLVGIIIWYRFPLGIALVTLPLWSLLALTAGLSVGMGLAALNVRFRDVGFVIPFLLQVWQYASPVAYSASIVPAKWAFWYQLNPMVGAIQGFRWAIVGVTGPIGVPWVAAMVVTLVLFCLSLFYFRQVERSFADLI